MGRGRERRGRERENDEVRGGGREIRETSVTHAYQAQRNSFC